MPYFALTRLHNCFLAPARNRGSAAVEWPTRSREVTWCNEFVWAWLGGCLSCNCHYAFWAFCCFVWTGRVAKCRLTSLLCTAWCKAWENEVAAWSLCVKPQGGNNQAIANESVKVRMTKMTKVFYLYLGRVLCKIRQGCKLCLVAKRVPQLHWCSTAIHGSGNCLIPQARCSKNWPAKASSQCAIEFLLPIQTFQHLPTMSVSQQYQCPRVSEPASVHWISTAFSWGNDLATHLPLNSRSTKLNAVRALPGQQQSRP